jgi:hypothetical protein
MSDVEEEHDYDWKYPKCGKSGTNCGDEIWEFCPYCGCTDLLEDARRLPKEFEELVLLSASKP